MAQVKLGTAFLFKSMFLRDYLPLVKRVGIVVTSALLTKSSSYRIEKILFRF